MRAKKYVQSLTLDASINEELWKSRGHSKSTAFLLREHEL